MQARRIIGITGPPGAGKSSIAAHLMAESPHDTVVVPMDGFHLAQTELARLGRSDRKGAPDTFDVHGFVALLRRIRTELDRTVFAPTFDRRLEEPIANAIAVEPHHHTVVTEGNYLLVDEDGWRDVAPLLDECRYVDCADEVRRSRLVARHIAHGRTEAEAVAWVETVDEPNARLIATRRRAATSLIDTTHRVG